MVVIFFFFNKYILFKLFEKKIKNISCELIKSFEPLRYF